MSLFPNQYYQIKKVVRHKQEIETAYQLHKNQNEDHQIQFYNWWSLDESVSLWLNDFIVKRGLLKNSTKRIALCSVFGEKEVLDLVDADVRIFFSGENLHNPRHAQYAGYMLDGKHPFDLGIGFDYFDDEKYIRFPLWMMYMFAPESTEEDIRKKCEILRYPQIGQRDKFAALIARADWNGKRGELADMISRYGDVMYPSAFRHNDDSLKECFNDNKIAYLRQFKFNICPENTNAYGYVTEKLFESISAGCIPVYWGCYNNPEPAIINADAVLFLQKDSKDVHLLQKIEDILQSPTDIETYLHKPRLLPTAEDCIIATFKKLETHIFNVLK